MEHTPKNILIRATKKKAKKIGNKPGAGATEMADFLNTHGTLEKLLNKSQENS